MRNLQALNIIFSWASSFNCLSFSFSLASFYCASSTFQALPRACKSCRVHTQHCGAPSRHPLTEIKTTTHLASCLGWRESLTQALKTPARGLKRRRSGMVGKLFSLLTRGGLLALTEMIPSSAALENLALKLSLGRLADDNNNTNGGKCAEKWKLKQGAQSKRKMQTFELLIRYASFCRFYAQYARLICKTYFDVCIGYGSVRG